MNVCSGANADFSHRSAISLNNIGCLLLEKGAFEQARATFTDCLFLLQRLASCDERLLAEEYSFHLQECLLQKASHRMAYPQPLKMRKQDEQDENLSVEAHGEPISVGHINEEDSTQRLQIKIFSMSDYSEFLSFEEILGNGRDMVSHKEFLICPCRIEDVCATSRGYDLGTVLFNLGTAYAALAKTCVSNGYDLNAFATKVFVLADRSFHVSLHRNNAFEEGNIYSDHVLRSVACTRLAILHGLMQTCEATGNTMVDDVVKRICQLQNAIFLSEQLSTGYDFTSLERRLPAASA